MDYTQDCTFKEFAWNSLTESQQVRIKLKYELKEKLKENNTSKREVYRYIATKFGFVTWQYVEKVAFHMNKKNNNEKV